MTTVDDVFKIISVPLQDVQKDRLLLFAMTPIEICAGTISELIPHLPEGTKSVEVALCLRTLRGEEIE